MTESKRRHAIVTGANGEIGRAIAIALAKDGFALHLTDLSTTGLDDFAATLGTDVACYAHDVADAEQTDKVVSEIALASGGIDVIIACAGLYQDLPLRSLTRDAWSKSLAVNLDGVFLTIRAALPHLTENSAIVTLTSVAGHRGSVDHTPYAAAKGGVLTLTRSLAQELAPRTRVNAVSPGLIDTRMMEQMDPERLRTSVNALPLKRLGKTAEIASVVAFLCGDGAAYITGETIHVNGGLYISG